MRAFIYTGGEIHPDNITEHPKGDDIRIAADSGFHTAKKCGDRIDILVGDLDSIGAYKLDKDVEVLQVPAEKDVTDTMLACEYAKEHGCRYITIIGGTGGRIDHSLSNVLYLEGLRREGIRVKLTDGENTVQVLLDETVTVPDDGGYFSVFALDSCIVTLTGCKYPLDCVRLVRQMPYAVSNEVVGEYATVRVDGVAILVMSKK